MALKIEYIEVSELIEYGKNARTHSDEQVEQLVNSIREFGFTNPVLIDEDNVLIAGHGRTMAAKQFGLDKVPCIRLSNLSDDKKRALRIADNQLALNAGWDLDMLADEVKDLNIEEFNLDLLGFDLDFIDDLLESSMDEIVDDRDRDEKEDDSRFVKRIFLLNENQLTFVDKAITQAKNIGNITGASEDIESNAITFICREYLKLKGR